MAGLVFLVGGGTGALVTMRRNQDKRASVFILVTVLGLVMLGSASVSILLARTS